MYAENFIYYGQEKSQGGARWAYFIYNILNNNKCMF